MDKRQVAYYPNMDIMRYVLAIAVVIAHIDYLTGYGIPFPLSSFEAVGGFFAISGFLMYPNYIRHTGAAAYARQRARRILPPYVFIVVACALSLALVSDLRPFAYFSSNGLAAYLAANLSFLNWLHPSLPGVFEGASYVTSAVNGSLWTMKVEWCLYFSVPCFIWITRRLRRLPLAWAALIVIIISIVYRQIFTSLYISTGIEAFNILRRQIFGQLAFFYSGMLIWFLKDFFIGNIWKMLLLGIVLRLLLPVVHPMVTVFIEPFAISAIVMALSLFPSDLKWLRHRFNVSYEIYLFHFPVIQLGIYLGVSSMGLAPMVAFSIIVTVALSVIVHAAVGHWQAHNRH